jgi:tetratricopeptide (TPR) repeat protein
MSLSPIAWNPRIDLRAQPLADYCHPQAASADPMPTDLAVMLDRPGNAPLLACTVADLPADAADALPAGGEPDDRLLQPAPGQLWRVPAAVFERHFRIDTALDPHIRVFLSSTFRDMLAERNFLATQVLPAVRQLCVLRGVQFTEIDLRWGITEEEARRGDVTHLCLREIDLSRESRPFFVGLLGERYGWVPGAQMVGAVLDTHDFGAAPPEALLEASVTELEFLYGPLRDMAFGNGALVYLRSPDLTMALAKASGTDGTPVEELVAGFGESTPAARAAQASLKARLRDAHLVRIDGYSTVAQAALDIQRMLFAEVERLNRGAPSVPQWLIAKRLADNAMPRATEAAWLSGWASRLTAGGADNLLLVAGEAGIGKSSLLARWMRDHARAHPDVAFLFYPFVGGGGSTPLEFIHFMLQALRINGDEFSSLKAEHVDVQIAVLHQLLAAMEAPLVVIADGIEVLGDERQTSLQWIPTGLAPQVKLVISSSLPEHEASLAKRGFTVRRLAGFDEAEADAFISHYLARFGKRLPEGSRSQLATARLGGNPQFLRIVLDELRLDASHEGLGERIASFTACATRRELCVAIVASWRQRALASGFEANFLHTIRELLASVDGLPEPVLRHRLGLTNADASRVLGFVYAHFLRPGGRIGIPDGDWRQALVGLLGATPADIVAWRMALVEALCAMPQDLVEPKFAAYECARQFVTVLRQGAPADRSGHLAWINAIAFERGRIWPIVEHANENLPILWGALGTDREAFDEAFAACAANAAAGAIDREALENAVFVLLEYQVFWRAVRACGRLALDAAVAANDEESVRTCAEMLLKSLAQDAFASREEAEELMHVLIDGLGDRSGVPIALARQAAEAQRLFAKVALECGEFELAGHFARQASLEYHLLVERLSEDDEQGGVTRELLSSAAHADNVAARVLREMRRADESQAFYHSAIELWSLAFSADNARVLTAQHERADVLIDCGPDHYPEARTLLERVIAQSEIIGTGGGHNTLYEAYRSLRKLHDREGRYDLAIAAIEKAIALQQQTDDYVEGDEIGLVYDYGLTLFRAERYRETLQQGVKVLRMSFASRRPRELQMLTGSAGLLQISLDRLEEHTLLFFLMRAANVEIERRHRSGGMPESRALHLWRQGTADMESQMAQELRDVPIPPLAEVLGRIDAYLSGADTGGGSGGESTVDAGSSIASSSPSPAGGAAPRQQQPLGIVAKSGQRCPEDGVWHAKLPAGVTASHTKRQFRSGETLPDLEFINLRPLRWLDRMLGERTEMRGVEWTLADYLPPRH